MSLQQLVHVAIPTSYAVCHPSTAQIQTAINNIRLLLPESPIYIYCDYPQDYLDRARRRDYWKYLRRLSKLNLGTLIRMDEWVGLSGIHSSIVKHNRLPLVFNYQHDWELQLPERIDTTRLLTALLDESNNVNYVRLAKRLYIRDGGHIDKNLIEVDQSVFGIPLIKTDGWSDNPHFATAQHYRTHVLPNMSNCRRPDGSSGVETYVCMAYRNAIKQLGFDRAHEQWGVYLYGKLRDYRYIHHLGLSTTTWRCELGYLPDRIRQ